MIGNFLKSLGLIGALVCVFASPIHSQPSARELRNFDQQAREILESREIDIQALLAQSERVIGISEGYAAEDITGVSYGDSAKELLVKYLVGFDKSGLQPIDIYISDRKSPATFWKIDFPGCEQGSCGKLANSQVLMPSDREEWNGFHVSGTRTEEIDLGSFEISGVEYTDFVRLFYDADFRLLEINRKSFRTAITFLEQIRAGMSSGGASQNVIFINQRKIASNKGIQ